MDNKILFFVLLAVAAFSALRVISRWRGFSVKRKPIDWDAHFIQSLRKAGVDTFAEHTVDFFFTMPTRPASSALGKDLTAEGYAVDVVPPYPTSTDSRKPPPAAIPHQLGRPPPATTHYLPVDSRPRKIICRSMTCPVGGTRSQP